MEILHDSESLNDCKNLLRLRVGGCKLVLDV